MYFKSCDYNALTILLKVYCVNDVLNVTPTLPIYLTIYLKIICVVSIKPVSRFSCLSTTLEENYSLSTTLEENYNLIKIGFKKTFFKKNMFSRYIIFKEQIKIVKMYMAKFNAAIPNGLKVMGFNNSSLIIHVNVVFDKTVTKIFQA